MKRITVFVLSLLLFMSFGVNAKSSIQVVIDGKSVAFTDVAPFIDENNRTLVPLRAIGDAMGLKVDWNSNEKIATFSKEYTWETSPYYQDEDHDGVYDTYLGYQKISFKIGNKIANYNEGWYSKGSTVKDNFPISGGIGEIEMDTAAINKDSRTFAPVRYLADIFRYDVSWNKATNTVNLKKLLTNYELGIKTELVAGWNDYQGWVFFADEDTKIASVKISKLMINNKSFEFNTLTKEEQQEIYDIYGDSLGKYLNGFLVYNNLEIKKDYYYSLQLSVIMEDGTQKDAIMDIYIYSDGGQGGVL